MCLKATLTAVVDEEQILKCKPVLGKYLTTGKRQRDAHASSVTHVPAMWLAFAR
jgi:hypothetical protein